MYFHALKNSKAAAPYTSHTHRHPASVTFSLRGSTGEFRRLGRCFIDWATAVVSEVHTCQLSVSFTCYSSGPIYVTLVESTLFYGIFLYFNVVVG